MLKKIIYSFIFLFLMFFVFQNVLAKDDRIEIWFFHSNGCPHCAAAEPVLEQMAKDNERVELMPFELTSSQENQERFLLMAQIYNKEANGVPTVLIGNQWIEGFDALAYKKALDYCLKNECENPSVKYNAWLMDPANKELAEKYNLSVDQENINNELYNTVAFLFVLTIIIIFVIIIFRYKKR